MKKLARVLIVLAPAALLAGCSSGPKKGESLSDIRHNLTPGMNTEDSRYVDVYNNLSIVHNDNIRKMHGDGLRAMLLDRPSRMSPVPDPR